VRVILVKLADRTHNMRTMEAMPRHRWQGISSETLEIYAPIAHRLGLNQTYRELQDLAFRHLKPWRYAILEKAVHKARSRRRDLLQKLQKEVETTFAKGHMDVRIFGREKTLYSIYLKMQSKHLSFAQVTDIYGMRILVPQLIDCYTGLGLLHQIYKPVPGKFKDHIAIAKVNGYQSLHTTLVGPAGINVEFQLRTEAMHLVAESGVAAHWLYKTPDSSEKSERLGTQWLQSLLDIQDETRDAAEFWDHVKVDLFPDAVYVFTPKSQIMSLPRGATVVDFAYMIHSNLGDHLVAAKINNQQVPLRTELKNGDVVEVMTAPVSAPNPSWLGFVRTGRARSRIRHHLKTMAHSESMELGLKLLTQALRSEGIEKMPDDPSRYHGLWDKLLRFTGNRNRSDLLVDVGLGKRIASIVAKRMAALLIELGEKPDPLLMTRERFMVNDTISQGAIMLDGTENASVVYSHCCRPLPGDKIIGYLGRGEGLGVHTADCSVGLKLQQKDRERFIGVEWSDEIMRSFETSISVTVVNTKGVLARVAGTLANSEVDIVHVEMGQSSEQDAAENTFIISVRDVSHLETVLKNLKRTPAVLNAERITHRVRGQSTAKE